MTNKSHDMRVAKRETTKKAKWCWKRQEPLFVCLVYFHKRPCSSYLLKLVSELSTLKKVAKTKKAKYEIGDCTKKCVLNK